MLLTKGKEAFPISQNLGRPEYMGRINQSLILAEILHNGPLSRADISRNTGLSKPSVSRSVGILLQENLLRKLPSRDHGKVGRKPELLSINHQACLFACVDIGGSNVTITIGNLSGEFVGNTESLKNNHHWDGIVETIHAGVKQLLSSAGFPVERLKGIGVAVQGVVDLGGFTVSSAPNIGDPDGYPLGEALRSYFSCPVLIENDVNAEALGEHWKGGARYSNMVHISLGTVVGGGLILNGQLFRGAHYYAGEIGWLIPGKDYLFRNLDKYGSLESLISGPAMTRTVESLIATGNFASDALAESSDLSPKNIFKYYKVGTSDLANHVVKEWLSNLGIAISNICSLLDPEAVILGGGLTHSGDFFLNELREIVNWGTQNPPELHIGRAKNASLYGMLKLCLDNYLGTLYAAKMGRQTACRNGGGG